MLGCMDVCLIWPDVSALISTATCAGVPGLLDGTTSNTFSPEQSSACM